MQRNTLQHYHLQPSPELSPEQVIKIQIKALKNNNSFDRDNGIEAAFVFASPENKTYTGPIERFARMVRNPLYIPMLNYKSALYEPIKILGNRAEQRVRLIDANDEE